MATAFPMGVRVPSADQIVGSVRTGISEPALSLVTPQMPAGEYIGELVRNQFLQDALRFMAYSMPIRHAVWWACLCLDLVSENYKPKEIEAIEACRNWVISPGDMERNAAERVSSLIPLDTPASILARSTSYVAVRLPQPKRGKPQNFPAKGIHSALWVSTSIAEDPDPLLAEYLKIGLAVSRGRMPWPEE